MGVRKNLIRISDAFAIFFLLAGCFYIAINTHFYKNKELYRIYVEGNYKNFQEIDRHDKMFVAATRLIDCSKYSASASERIDIYIGAFLIIETSFYLDVFIEKHTNLQCVDRVMFRSMP